MAETIDNIKRKYSQNFTKVELEKLTVNYYSIYAARIVRDFIIQKKYLEKKFKKKRTSLIWLWRQISKIKQGTSFARLLNGILDNQNQLYIREWDEKKHSHRKNKPHISDYESKTQMFVTD